MCSYSLQDFIPLIFFSPVGGRRQRAMPRLNIVHMTNHTKTHGKVA